MIPASYLYKDAFRQAWYEEDIQAAIARCEEHRPRGRNVPHLWLTRLAAAVESLRRNNRHNAHA